MLWTFAKLVSCLVLASGLAGASLLNGGFESIESGAWEKDGYVDVSSGRAYGAAQDVLPDSGEYAMRLVSMRSPLSLFVDRMSIDVEILSASNGDVLPNPGALIWQSAAVEAGDTLEFRWNFVSDDNLDFDDWAFYGIQFESIATQLTRIASVASVGPATEDGPTISGWTTHRVVLPQSGTYTIYFGIVNAINDRNSSELWVDNVSIQSDSGPGSEVPEPATFALLAPFAIALLLRRRRAG
ncbi:MAG: PEP-CTERM sorting domain-containing protein [Bryobacterales bacterium]|nr:PEP-CTERM sorting domain-containing protein [Bryobacterales bacterium]